MIYITAHLFQGSSANVQRTETCTPVDRDILHQQWIEAGHSDCFHSSTMMLPAIAQMTKEKGDLMRIPIKYILLLKDKRLSLNMFTSQQNKSDS